MLLGAHARTPHHLKCLRSTYQGHGAFLPLVLPFFLCYLLAKRARHRHKLPCVAPVSCGKGETPVRQDACWLGNAVPKGLGASQTCREELSSSWPRGERADGFAITLQRVGEFHFRASEA